MLSRRWVPFRRVVRLSEPRLAAVWAERSAEASAQMGTTAYGTPARTRPVTPGMQSGEPAFSPDGRYVAVGIGRNTGDGMAFSVVVVEVASGRQGAGFGLATYELAGTRLKRTRTVAGFSSPSLQEWCGVAVRPCIAS
ncbi:MAG: hypothetical protein ACXVJA_18655 [Acidimicrobiia bacterium]